MAYTIISGPSTVGSTTGNNAAVTINTVGAGLIIVAICSNTSAAATISDSQSMTPTGQTQQSGTNARVRIYRYESPTTNASHTFTATSTAGAPTISAIALSGQLTSPFDVENGTTALAVATIQPGSITPSLNNEIVIAALAAATTNNAVPTIGSGFTGSFVTRVAGQHVAGGMAYLVQTSAAAINPTFTIADTVNVAATIASYKALTASAHLGMNRFANLHAIGKPGMRVM